MAKKNEQPTEAAGSLPDRPAVRNRRPATRRFVSGSSGRSLHWNNLSPPGNTTSRSRWASTSSIRQAVFALKTAREEAGLSLADVAERTGIDKGRCRGSRPAST